MSVSTGSSPVFAALLMVAAAPVLGANITVKSTLDATDANPGDGICETAVGNGICTLRAAIQESNANGAALNTIVVPAGTYTLTLAGANEDAAASGDLDVLGTVAINGDAAATTIIDAAGIDRVFDIGSGATVTLSRLSIRGGGNVQTGGGIQNAGNLALIACVVEDNGGNAAPVRFGAGIANLKALVVTDSVVQNNQAGATTQSGAGGGGIYSLLAASISGSTITGNSAVGVGALGGGVFSQDPAVTQIATTTIDANTAPQAGGIALIGGQLLLSTSLLADNTATTSNGGGGGLRVVGGSASVVNTTISGNTTLGSGGGISIASGAADLGNATLAFNTANSAHAGAGHGGGVQIASGATLTARNSIIANNTDAAPSSSQPDCSGALTSNGYILLRSTTGCTLTSSSGDITGADPQLSPLADNGGPTMTHAIAATSVAVDGGNPAGCTGFNGTSLLTDQRGSQRPSDGNDDGMAVCDIGAYELLSDEIFGNGFETSQ